MNQHLVKSSEQLDHLVKQWGAANDTVQAETTLLHIAILIGFTRRISPQLSELESHRVLQWLQDNYPYAYLLALSQRSVGHPAMIWGRKLSTQTKMAAAWRRA